MHVNRGFDMLNDNARISIDNKVGIRHSTHVELNSFKDLAPVLKQIFKNRMSKHTTMNNANKATAGSSRTHAALILTLHQINSQGVYQKSKYTLMDLAGAERPDKVGGERTSIDAVVGKLYRDEEFTLAEQSMAINWDL